MNSPALGNFVCVSAEYEDVSLEPSLAYGGDVVLELGENGWGSFYLGDEGGLINWSLTGNELKLVFNDKTYAAVYEDDCIEMELLDSGLKMNFVRLGSEIEIESKSEVLAYYGWWDIGDASGQWQDYKDMWFDSCAVIEFSDNGTGELIMWDEDSSYAEPISRIKVSRDEDGALSVIEGAFINCEINQDNLHFNTAVDDYPEMIIGELAYSDSEGVFNSVIYLRPWGYIWDDVQENAPELLPYHYEDWYLPLVNAGSQMPGEFELN